MSTLALRSAAVSRLSGLPFSEACKTYFLLGCNTRGQWVIRENSGRRAGVFLSRQAALRFARLESPDGQFAVVHLPDGLEFDHAA